MKTLKERMEATALGQALIHWVIPDLAGPVVSKPIEGISKGGIYKTACGAKLGTMGELQVVHQGTGETHAVTCEDCMKHADFAATYIPRPGINYEEIPEQHRKLVEEMEAKLQAKGR